MGARARIGSDARGAASRAFSAGSRSSTAIGDHIVCVGEVLHFDRCRKTGAPRVFRGGRSRACGTSQDGRSWPGTTARGQIRTAGTAGSRRESAPVAWLRHSGGPTGAVVNPGPPDDRRQPALADSAPSARNALLCDPGRHSALGLALLYMRRRAKVAMRPALCRHAAVRRLWPWIEVSLRRRSHSVPS